MPETPMPDERDLARRSLDYQARARDYRMTDLPGYMEWSRSKLAEGHSEAEIAHLDATSVRFLPEDAAKLTTDDYEEMLEDLEASLELEREHGSD
jgi:hypothetical protein